MISRLELGALVVVAVAVFLAAVAIAGGEISARWVAYIGATITVVGFIVAAYDKWIWRLPILQGWFVTRPNINGRWSVSIRTNWTDSDGGARAPIAATFEVKQTRSGVHVRMKSDESDGELVCASIVPRDGEGYWLVGTFRNEPKLSVRDRSSIHYGSFILDIEGNPRVPASMTGRYWTDRGTRGEMVAERRAD